MKFHEDGTLPEKDQIFVFGSNLAGRHGAGAAKKALDYGAKYGIGIGLYGQTYAIPTKDAYIETLPIASVATFISKFCEFADTNSNLQFFITRVGCGLAGFSDDQIAPLFFGCSDNCDFPENWKSFLETK